MRTLTAKATTAAKKTKIPTAMSAIVIPGDRTGGEAAVVVEEEEVAEGETEREVEG